MINNMATQNCKTAAEKNSVQKRRVFPMTVFTEK
jgi:hypothetical protein